MEKHNDTKIHTASNNDSVNAGQEGAISIFDSFEEEVMYHSKNGCSYGQPDGPDDYFKDCDCGE